MIQNDMQKKSTPSSASSIFLILTLVLIIASLIATILVYLINRQPQILKVMFPDAHSLIILIVCAVIYLLHFLALAWGRISTHAARAFGFLMIGLALGVLLTLWIGDSSIQNYDLYDNFFRMLYTYYFLVLFVPCLFWIGGLSIFSMPCNFFSSLPLLFYYLTFALIVIHPKYGFIIISFFYVPLAAFIFPRHRRLAEYWRPTRLPRIKSPKPAAQ